MKILDALLMVAFVTLLMTVAASRASAWQLGWNTQDSDYMYGVQSDQYVHGHVPGDINSWVSAVTGFFTSQNNKWVTVGYGSATHGTDVYTAGEAPPGGFRLCNGVGLDHIFLNRIYYDFTFKSWIWTSSACVNSMSWTPSCCIDHVNGAGSWDMMESTDTNAGDFTNDKAEVDFLPSLGYMDTNSVWHWATESVSYNSAAVNSVGPNYLCNSPHLYVSSINAPPWNGGVEKCT